MTSNSSFPLVSVIVSNLNGQEVLIDCLESLGELTYPNYEVIVVDAKSSDGSVELIKERFPWVGLIEADKVGVGEAINMGIRMSRGELIVFDFNNDEVAHPQWLSHLVEALTQSTDIGIAGGTRVFNYSKQFISDAGVYLDFFFHTHDRYHLRRIDELPKRIVDVDFVNIGLFRREIIGEVGWFDQDFYFYGEDADFCLRVRKNGKRVINVPRAITTERGSFTVGEGSAKQIYFSRRAGLRLVLKHRAPGPIIACVIERALLLLAEFLLDLVSKVHGAKISSHTNGFASLRGFIWNMARLRSTFDSRRFVEKLELSASRTTIPVSPNRRHEPSSTS